MREMRHGRMYRVTGASGATGEDVEILVEAHDEADAARAANRKGVFVSGCAAAGGDGSNWAAQARDVATPGDAAPAASPPAPVTSFAQYVGADAVVRRLVRAHARLSFPVARLSSDDRTYLANLGRAGMGISTDDAAHVRELIRNPGHLE